MQENVPLILRTAIYLFIFGKFFFGSGWVYFSIYVHHLRTNDGGKFPLLLPFEFLE